MQVSDLQQAGRNPSNSIIKRLYTGFEFEDVESELCELIDLYLRVRDEGGCLVSSFSGSVNKYDLEMMEGSGNHVSNIYAVLSDGIPRTTSKSRNRLTGEIEDSALHRELYQRFKCCPSDRAVMARISNIRNNTKSTPSVVYSTDKTLVDGRSYKRRFYFLVEDGFGRSGSVPIEECPKWHLRKIK